VSLHIWPLTREKENKRKISQQFISSGRRGYNNGCGNCQKGLSTSAFAPLLSRAISSVIILFIG
jgi:hypothetical protein